MAYTWSVANRTAGVIKAHRLERIPGFTAGDDIELVASELWESRDDQFVIVDLAERVAEQEAIDKKRAGDCERQARRRAKKSSECDNQRDVTQTVTHDVTHDVTRDSRAVLSLGPSSLPNPPSKENLSSNQPFSSLAPSPWSGTELEGASFSGELDADAKRRARAWKAKMTPEARSLVPTGQGPTERDRLLGFIGDLLADGATHEDLRRCSDRYMSDLSDGIETYPKHYVSRIYPQITAEKNITPEIRRNGMRLSTGQKRAADTLSLDDSSPDLLLQRRINRQKELPQ